MSDDRDVQELIPESVELLQALIRNRCVNDGRMPAPEAPSTALVTGLLEGTSFDMQVFEPEPGRTSLIARLPGTDPQAPSLMLLAHTDVVPVHAERWIHDPFGAEVIDGSVWGRGALDMLGHVATMTLAARDYARAGRHRGGDIVVAMVADEEALGGAGMGWLVEHARDAVRADWVVTEMGGTPLDATGDGALSVMRSEKGAWRVRLRALGQPAHSSMPYGSTNALVVAADAIRCISAHLPEPNMSAEWHRFAQEAMGLDEGSPVRTAELVDAVVAMMPDRGSRLVHALTRMTIVPTAVDADFSWNTVPASVTIDLDVRTVPGQTRDDIMAAVTKSLAPIGDAIVIDSITGMEATSSPPDTRLWGLLQESIRPQVGERSLVGTMSPGVTDARFMRAIGATAYGFGIVSPMAPLSEIPRMLHGDNERVDVLTLGMMRRLWGDLLTRFADESTS